MLWVRIDNRLIHGQVIETWLPYTGANTLMVANDELAADVLQQEIMSLAIPQSISCRFLRVEELAPAYAQTVSSRGTDVLVLFAGCADARRAFDGGFLFENINVGNIHYSPGRIQVSPSVALSEDDQICLRFFSRKGVHLDFRCVPNDPIQVKFA